MNALTLTADLGAASAQRSAQSRCARCSASTSGRAFGAPPAVERAQPGLWRSGEDVMQAAHTATATTRRTSRLEATKSNKSTQEQQGVATPSAGQSFTGLVNDLLFGAASRMERGRTTCIQCKGSGTCTCINCRGQGIVKPDKLKKASDPVRQAANAVSSMLGSSSSTQYNSHMLRSNRCQKCHGSGVRTCNACHGIGFRGDEE